MGRKNKYKFLNSSLTSDVAGLYRATAYLLEGPLLAELNIESRSKRITHKILNEIQCNNYLSRSANLLGLCIEKQLKKSFHINLDEGQCAALAQSLIQKIRIELRIKHKYSQLIDPWSAELLKYDLAIVLQYVNFRTEKDYFFYEYRSEALQMLDEVDRSQDLLNNYEKFGEIIKLIVDRSFYGNFSLKLCENIAIDLISSVNEKFDKEDFLARLAIPKTKYIPISVD